MHERKGDWNDERVFSSRVIHDNDVRTIAFDIIACIYSVKLRTDNRSLKPLSELSR